MAEIERAEAPAADDRVEALGRRVAAALLDVAIFIALFVVLGLLVGERYSSGQEFRVVLSNGWSLVWLVLVLLYYFALEAFDGRTIGKRALGLRVERTDGSTPGVGAIAVRTLVRLVDALPFLYLLGFIVVLVTGHRRQRLGDLAARTQVVRATRPQRDDSAYGGP